MKTKLGQNLSVILVLLFALNSQAIESSESEININIVKAAGAMTLKCGLSAGIVGITAAFESVPFFSLAALEFATYGAALVGDPEAAEKMRIHCGENDWATVSEINAGKKCIDGEYANDLAFQRLFLGGLAPSTIVVLSKYSREGFRVLTGRPATQADIEASKSDDGKVANLYLGSYLYKETTFTADNSACGQARTQFVDLLLKRKFGN